ncbi:MAG: hypothetical protein IJ370_08210 [Oscillospiraceae bacterium]|nr:hypothetical protein [Oscillospiraceae bacterium]
MAISVYRLLKARGDKHKVLWVLVTLSSPIIARIAYEIYCRWIVKVNIEKIKGNVIFLVLSIVSVVLSAIITVISVVSIGVGYIKSEIDGEPLAVFYDMHGNEYSSTHDVPLHDKEGNTYVHEPEWFTVGTYVDQNGKTYDASYCYLSEDGYFYYDANGELKPYKDSYDYYTDGDKIYFSLPSYIYWEEDGTIYEQSGRYHLKLFDFDK